MKLRVRGFYLESLYLKIGLCRSLAKVKKYTGRINSDNSPYSKQHYLPQLIQASDDRTNLACSFR